MRCLPAALVLLAAFAVQPPPVLAADDSDCAICHEDVANAFARTGHAMAPGWGTTLGCQSCHGDGDAHIEGGGDLEAIIRPQLLSSRDSSRNCLDCHQKQERHFTGAAALHGLNDVGCLNCHDVHTTANHSLVAPTEQLCASCHPNVASQFEMPRAHPMVGEGGGPGCVNCHDPHASRRTHSRTSGDGACSNCHFSKSGPFVYEHDVSIVDGCAACHEVHGSTNRHLLKHDRQINLCYECHNANLTPGWHSAARFANQKCTACHAAIHGSNTNQFFLEE